MQTRCPTCQTLYQIDDAALRQADGQARCCRCDSVFDAAQHAAGDDTEPAEAGSAAAAAPDSGEQLPTGDIPDTAAGNDDWARPEPLDDGDDVLDLSAIAADTGAADPDELLPFHVPDDLPDLEPTEHAALTPEQALEAAPPHAAQHGWMQRLATALLILVALGQLAWQYREQVLATPAGHALAEGLCSLAPCRVTARRAPSRYTLLERNIAPAQGPGGETTLAMRLSFRNSADFAQPLPDIQLSLYDSEQRLMARRRLHPDEYLFPAPAADFLVESGGLVQVELQLEDPGRKAVAFKLNFL
jgi:predicted Zn finger-like uncharacterized protein